MIIAILVFGIVCFLLAMFVRHIAKCLVNLEQRVVKLEEKKVSEYKHKTMWG